MNRIINSLLKLLLGHSLIDDLAPGQDCTLPDARFDKGRKSFTIHLTAHRDR